MSSSITWEKQKVRNGRSEGNNFSTFKTCKKVIDDPYWFSILEAAGKGNLPEGFTWICKERRLIYTDDKFQFNYDITRNTREAAQQIINAFKKHAVQYPQTHHIPSKVTSFKDVKGHNINIMLKIFFMNEVKTHNLNKSQQRYLAVLIARMMLRGDLNDDVIEFKNGIIVGINNIQFDGERYVEVDYMSDE